MVGDFFTPDLDTGTMPFPGSTDETHFSTAWWMAKFSELAYEDQNTIADELDAIKNIDCDYFVFFENQDTEAYIARFTQGFAVLAFRGTEKDYFDIVTDISALMRPIGSATGAKVHGGFLTGFQNVWGTFAPRKYQEYQKYQENQESETPHEMEIRVEGRPKGIANILSDFGFCGSDELDLYITGHSLGGALASIAGYYLSDSKAFYSEQLNIAGVYTFGAPRLFDKKAEQRFQESDIDCHRFIYDADIVAQLPPSMPGLLE